MIRRTRHLTALALAIALPLAACEDDSALDADEGRISIRATASAGDVEAPGDAPGAAPVEAAVVTISEIYLQGGGGQDGEGEDGVEGRVILRDEPVTTDLLSLANDVETLVEDAVIPDGAYAQLRFVITGGYLAVENAQGDIEVFVTDGYEPPEGFEFPEGSEVVGTLHCPSCGQSGLKVDVRDGLVIEDDEELLVEFDVADSFGHEAGHSGRWVMKPVIEGSASEAAGSVRVSIALAVDVTLPVIGEVQIGLGDLEVSLTDENGNTETLTLTDDDEDGTFEAEFMFLLPGSYELDLVLPDGLALETDPVLPLSLDIEAGATAEASIDVTSASGG